MDDRSRLLGLGGVLSAYGALAVTFCAACYQGFRAPAGPVVTRSDFSPALLVVVGAIAQAYALLFTQSTTALEEFGKARAAAKSRGEKSPALATIKYGTDNSRVVAANRCAANYLEQLVPFLISLCAYAVYVSAFRAAVFGWAWVLCRAYYPIVFRGYGPTVLLSTIPAYWLIWWMLAAAAHAALTQQGT